MTNEEAKYDNLKNQFISDFYDGRTTFYYIPQELENDTDVIQLVLERNPLDLANCTIEIKENYNLCWLAVSLNGAAFEYIDTEYQKEMRFIKLALEDTLEALHFVPDEMFETKELQEYLMGYIDNPLFKEDFKILHAILLNKKISEEHEENLLNQISTVSKEMVIKKKMKV